MQPREGKYSASNVGLDCLQASRFPGRCCDKIAGPGNLCPDDEQQRGGQEFVCLLIAVICLAIRYL